MAPLSASQTRPGRGVGELVGTGVLVRVLVRVAVGGVPVRVGVLVLAGTEVLVGPGVLDPEVLITTKTLNSGPVMGIAAQPMGAAALRPARGRLKLPPAYVPEATGAERKSWALRIS